MYLSTAPNAVEIGYGDGSLNMRRLHEFCMATNGNFSVMQSEINTMQMRLNEVNATNKQLTQLLNWIAVTNPQILDEFQTTAHAFDKLVPREPSEFTGPQSAP
jgi:hypothetical protein